MKVYVLLPAYNEEASIDLLLKRIKIGMEHRGLSYEVVVYNDGSTDSTLELLRENSNDVPLRIIGKERNEGLGKAFCALLKEVTSIADEDDIAIVLDCDNTHNPEYVYQMVNRIREGFDVVIASRYRQDSRIIGVTLFRQFLSLGASWVMRILFPIKGVRDFTCGYRAYRVALLQRMIRIYGDQVVEESGFACMAEFLIKLRRVGVLAVEVPLILRYDRKRGASKMNISKTIRRTLVMLYGMKSRHPRAGQEFVAPTVEIDR